MIWDSACPPSCGARHEGGWAKNPIAVIPTGLPTAVTPSISLLSMMQRGGQVVINLMANVKQKTIEPFIKETIVPGTLLYTDEYSIYARLCAWGYEHKSVNHGRGEYARDEDGDGFCEVHVNTMEGFWSLLRSWLRPHRGISQEKLPFYLGFFEFVHNVRKRGKALLHALIALLVT
jgi:transposase